MRRKTKCCFHASFKFGKVKCLENKTILISSSRSSQANGLCSPGGASAAHDDEAKEASCAAAATMLIAEGGCGGGGEWLVEGSMATPTGDTGTTVIRLKLEK